MKKIPEDIQILLKKVIDQFDGEDRATRERQILTWKKLKLFWDGFQHIWFDSVAHDWRIGDNKDDVNADQAYYDKPINIFKAYLESIIAALSVTIPAVKCFPDDADNDLDLATARASDKIAQLIYRHNDVSLLWLHALYIYCTEGLVACYSYSKDDKKYGTYQETEYKDEEEIHKYAICPNCGHTIDDTLLEGEFDPNAESLMDICPSCNMEVQPQTQIETLVVTKIVGVTTNPKSRQCMEIYGGLYVKVPNYARKQDDCPYLNFSYETHYSNARARYPEIRDKITSTSGSADEYERWGRLSAQYQGEQPRDTVTMRHWWLRPTAFEILDEEECKKLLKYFPIGAKVDLVNDIFAEGQNESLDDHWTLTHNPLTDYIHHDPLGLTLTPVQEITNDLVALVLQTIEHGIPQTFADPGVLNFNTYRQTEVAPGSIFPATPKSGKSVGEAFYEVKTATLSQEVLPFSQQIQAFGQVVSGALPSLFGGALEGSKTASEYGMSRAQALQRLQSTWKIFTVWWKQIMGKAIPAYIKDMKEDERYVEKDSFGSFINIFIRRAELDGKIGDIELEASEQLPISWAQQRDAFMKLFELNNPVVMELLTSPENLPQFRDALGLTDITIPGEEDRNKQYAEIKQLLNSEPIVVPMMPDMGMGMESGMGMSPEMGTDPMMDPMMQDPEYMMQDPMMAEQEMMMQAPQEQEQPSVEIDPEFDNHEIQFEVCRRWIVSDAGRLAKLENGPGYRNVLLHARAHQMILQQNMQAQAEMQQASAGPQQKAQGVKKNAQESVSVA